MPKPYQHLCERFFDLMSRSPLLLLCIPTPMVKDDAHVIQATSGPQSEFKVRINARV